MPSSRMLLAACTCGAASLAFAADAPTASTSMTSAQMSMAVQDVHNAAVAARAAKTFYAADKFDLSGLPDYKPEQEVTGTLRIWGNNYLGDGKLGEYWMDEFKKFHPRVSFYNYLPTSAAGFPGIYLGLADLTMNHKPGFYDLLAYQRIMDSDPLEITVVTGSLSTPGWQNAYAILVNKNNPIAHLSMKQLDGIFGAERDGGWVGTAWHPEFRRGKEGNIRTWGQLGLKGEWADKPIHPMGYSLRYNTSTDFADKVLQGSDKWNENIRLFAHFIKPDGTRYMQVDQMTDLIAKDPYAIAYVLYKGDAPNVRTVDIGQTDAGPFVPLNIDTVQNRTYPLFGQFYFYVPVLPGAKMDPKVREFTRFVLSKQGQMAVARDGKYMPLTKEVVEQERKKLD